MSIQSRAGWTDRATQLPLISQPFTLYYECKTDKHFKFYKMSWKFDSGLWILRTWRGKIGTKGQRQDWSYQKRKELWKKIRSLHKIRLRHGYQRKRANRERKIRYIQLCFPFMNSSREDTNTDIAPH
jgi:predicted DNA-binding WGR domain protein